MVRFGVSITDQPLVDDVFMQEAAPYSPILKRLIEKAPLSREDIHRVECVPLLLRRVFRSLTARTLRRLATLCDPERVEIVVEDAAPQSALDKLLDFCFPPVELLLIAGRTGTIRYADTAARIYEIPPNLAEQRWLFEWQSDDLDCPWPVMTSRQAEIKTVTALQIGNLGYTLSRYLLTLPGPPLARGLRAEIVISDAYIYYLVSTQQYFSLIIYQVEQLGRLLKSLEQLIGAEAAEKPAARRPGSGLGSALGSAVGPPVGLPGLSAVRSLPRNGPGPAPVLLPLPEPLRADASAERPGAPTPLLPTEERAVAVQRTVLPQPAVPPAADGPREPRSAAVSEPAPAPSPAAPPAPAPVAPPAPAASEPARTPLALPAPVALAAPAGPPPAAAEPARTPPAVAPAQDAALGPPAPTAATAATAAFEEAPRSAGAPAGPERSHPPLLLLRRLTAQLERRTILKDVELELGPRGVYALMGPGGSGKSSLLGLLSGRNRAGTGWTTQGLVLYEGNPLGSRRRPAVLGQRIGRPTLPVRSYLIEYVDDPEHSGSPERLVELLARCQLERLAGRLDDVLGHAVHLSPGEWWRLAIARELLAEPPLLCVDEPTAGLPDSEAQLVLSLLRAEGRRRAVLMVSHHQQHVRDCSDHVFLLAAGQLLESLPTQDFFERPRSRVAQDYVRTGGCYVPSPDARTEELEPAALPEVQPAREPGPAAPAPAPIEAAEDEQAAPDPESAPPAILWEDTTPVLRLRDFGVRFGARQVLRGLNLDIAPRGAHVLVIPDGGAKRLLLRALCGPRSGQLAPSGQALYRGAELSDDNLPATATTDVRLLSQRVLAYLLGPASAAPNQLPREEQRERVVQRLRSAGFPELAERLDLEVSSLDLPERRVLDLLRAASAEPALLCLDEPLGQLPAAEQGRVLALLRELAVQRALLILAQDPTPYARERAGWQLSLGFFTARGLSATPPAPAPAPAAPVPPLAPPVDSGRAPSAPAAAPEPVPPPQPPATGAGPRGFRWLRDHALAGMPAPGVFADVEYDLDLIRSAGVTYLVTLTTTPLPAELLRRHGLQGLFFPIEDMDAPSLEAAGSLCEEVAALRARGEVIGFHCKAGYGRTGTMLAAQLIWEGADAAAALAAVRAVEPNWVQSPQQERFLVNLAARRRNHRPHR
ncbi:MAG: ATP-binding cassette domain-containing protein [Polyangia bacterium]